MGAADTATYYNNFIVIQQTCQDFSIPLALKKLEGPSHTLKFLRIELDTTHMEARLPEEKLLCIHALLTSWLTKKEGYKEGDSVTRGTSPTCEQSCATRKNVYGKDVQHSSQSKKVKLLHPL